MKRQQRTIVLAICLLLCGSLTFAQSITASLQGTVTDKLGAVLPKATITVTNTETGFVRSTAASESGEYRISSLPVGNYKVMAQSASFQPQTRVVQLAVGDTPTLDFVLSPGQVEQQVTVTAEAPLIEPTRTSTDSGNRPGADPESSGEWATIYRFRAACARCDHRRHDFRKHGRDH